jgi:hypothetical protein
MRSPAREQPVFRFSGHQTFPLRLSWLPKAVAAISKGVDPLTDIDLGITKLGLGKNMVEALRCWIEAFQVANKTENGWELTPVGLLVFDPKTGADPFLEDHTTAWLLHWLICTDAKAPFFAWECLFNRWPALDFSASQVQNAFRRESDQTPRPASPVTLRQHWEVFIHSYRPPRAIKGEDHLDCVLAQLGLITETGDRPVSDGRRETRYEFDISPKHAIPHQFFSFILHDWWNQRFPEEQTVRLAELVAGDRSPGRLLKMPEREILGRLQTLSKARSPSFALAESANLRLLRRLGTSDGHRDLREAYSNPVYP